ncbi:malto-oligosyltrehalose synthase [Luteimicrobium xylanilyticum]|uniref:(1->4)-alpha-D-glucan 1-alpha-D-glucosylmutase n=1 Tax=Luteimicrobium xylanilyticum TaxID=1133546 RepID=A0A5P9QBH3_9MICO|nr:malto-oligosyltrehalose synthase [Luteimicrobium xylanilyticum]QFU98422.1 (1->4)-alpha-D-glucan 1-alpha-D-glucosylmutase [Luteimicrobium xylanilyticum]
MTAPVLARRRPDPGRPVPVSTYRLQLGPDLTFDDAARQVPYLAALGVTHLYLSPVLQAAPGSTHGYDVVDHTRVSDVMGGRPGLDRLAAAAHAHGLGTVLDVVPNHMAVPVPEWHNRALWSVLAHGPESEYAHWFDVDWSAGDGAVLLPVLGARLPDVLAADQLALDEVVLPGDETPTAVLRYFDHVLPVRPGTESLALTDLLEHQHYRLAYWRVGDEELNYRRFFDVGSLVAIRVEDERVFDATHALVLELLADGTIDGLRIDHPDGLADPGGYLERLAERTGRSWVAVEKILEGDETLPPDWETVGTTGYDALWRLQELFVDPRGRTNLARLQRAAEPDASEGLEPLVARSKAEVLDGALYAELHRLTDLARAVCQDDPRLRDHAWRALHECLAALLVEFDRYRAYVVPGVEPRREAVDAVEAAAARARTDLPADRAETLDVLVALLLGREVGSAGRTRGPRRDELVVRFQQVCGAVMAKGVEDTAFYRWTELTSLCEVGADPVPFSLDPHAWHAFAETFGALTPLAMTTGSTHDTKRNEDTRAALGVLSERGGAWEATVAGLEARTRTRRSALVDGHAATLLWQTLAGTWDPDADEGRGAPIAEDRLADYLLKALREAKLRTSWTDGDTAYEEAVVELARATLTDDACVELLRAWSRDGERALRAASLGIKLVQLTMPGVADVYQGSEGFAPALVDPDNRRPVDHEALAARLARLDEGAGARTLSDQKLLVTSRALRVRRAEPETFVGAGAGYLPLPTSSPCAVAFARTRDGEARAVTVVTRLATELDGTGGWREHTVVLPEGRWNDVLTGVRVAGGAVRLDALLASLPAALLVPDDAPAGEER